MGRAAGGYGGCVTRILTARVHREATRAALQAQGQIFLHLRLLARPRSRNSLSIRTVEDCRP